MSSITDTIAAIATPLGSGALAVVKMSGTECLQVACALLQIPLHALRPRYASLRPLYDHNGAILDEVIVLYFQAPHSYTGEDVIEFQCHGGSFIAHAILDSVLQFACVRLARPGEFSLRAVIAGKMDITQAEAIAKLISVKDATNQHLLVRQLRGSLSDFIARERHVLLEFLATSEVSIDYAEEDLPHNLLQSISERIHERIAQFERLLDVSRSYERFSNGFHIALLGKPNTGKSSLLNALLLRERAIVSDIAGTTRDTIEESCMIAQHQLRIIDTAGVRESTDSIEQQGITRSLASCEQSDIVLAVFDASSPLTQEDEAIINRLPTFAHVLVVLNQIDKGIVIDTSRFLQWECVEVSAKNGQIAPLLHVLRQKLESKPAEDIILSSKRQIQAFVSVVDCLRQSLQPLSSGELELFSFWIKEALNALNTITSPHHTEELLDMIFGQFCLGK